MTKPSTGSRSIEIDASPEDVYDLITDVTQMGRWSPETRSCEWLDEPGRAGSRFKGHNRTGPMRWTTTVQVEVAERPREFTFATIYKDSPATRWSYTLEGEATTTLTESFESVYTPLLIAWAERWVIRDRQEQLEAGMERTLAAIKAVAEGQA
jgi:uncharacterized protein YndB with AHSA1/START domain